jgi:hypothetical protein
MYNHLSSQQFYKPSSLQSSVNEITNLNTTKRYCIRKAVFLVLGCNEISKERLLRCLLTSNLSPMTLRSNQTYKRSSQ